MKTPKVSVLLPVYNAEKFLSAAVSSVLDQSFDDFELLIIDDGSTDRSLEILRGYAAKDARIRVISRENRGLCATLNELIDLARGEYAARMDADDICEPERFRRQVDYLDAHRDVLVLGGASEQIDAAGRPIQLAIPPLDHADIDRRHIAGCCSIEHPTVMMRLRDLKAVGGYRLEMESAEDLDLWLRLAETGNLANLPDKILQYRVHDQSISAKRAEEQAQRTRLACEAAWTRRGLVDPVFEYTQWRSDGSRGSRRDYSLKYAWQAWRAGNRSTAIHYASRAVRIDPLAMTAWKALAVTLLKRPPTPVG